MKVKEQALRANAKVTIGLATATMKKAEQIAQQKTISLFTLEDKSITCDIARQWVLLRRTQELAKLQAEVANDPVAALAASATHVPPRSGVRSLIEHPPLCTLPPAPAPTQQVKD